MDRLVLRILYVPVIYMQTRWVIGKFGLLRCHRHQRQRDMQSSTMRQVVHEKTLRLMESQSEPIALECDQGKQRSEMKGTF